VFAPDLAKPGRDLQTGSITEDQLARALDQLKSDGFFAAHKEPGLAPDMSHVIISARRENTAATHRWSENLIPKWSANVNATVEFKEFARMWALTRTDLAFALPEQAVPLAQDKDVKKRFDSVVSWDVSH